MNKTEKLDSLFDKWIEDFPKYKGKFNRDGIINEHEYERQSTKLLFLAKEPNDPKQSEGDFREWWSKGVKYSFSHRICEWAYGLLNDFPPVVNLPYSDEKRKEVMAKIAFMNLKKSGGKASADHDAIAQTLKEEQKYILEEINIISPEVIIGGIGCREYWKYIFPEVQFKDSGFDIKVARANRYKIIDYYHPSYRVPRSMSYSLLSMVSNSDVFRNL